MQCLTRDTVLGMGFEVTVLGKGFNYAFHNLPIKTEVERLYVNMTIERNSCAATPTLFLSA